MQLVLCIADPTADYGIVSEVVVAPELVKELDVIDRLVTADAPYWQVKTATYIPAKQGDSFLTLKVTRPESRG